MSSRFRFLFTLLIFSLSVALYLRLVHERHCPVYSFEAVVPGDPGNFVCVCAYNAGCVGPSCQELVVMNTIANGFSYACSSCTCSTNQSLKLHPAGPRVGQPAKSNLGVVLQAVNKLSATTFNDSHDGRLQKCLSYRLSYDVLPLLSWGSLPPEKQTDWEHTLNCNDFQSDFPLPVISLYINLASSEEKRDCSLLAAKYNIDVRLKSWGSAPVFVQNAWMFDGCDYYFYDAEEVNQVADECEQTLFDYRIALITPLSANGLKEQDLITLPLWSTMLPSLKSTMHPLSKTKNVGFDFYFGFDAGDSVLDTPNAHKQFLEMFHSVMGTSGVGQIRMRLFRLGTGFTAGAPSWAVGALASIAVRDGVDYLFQVNDDTEFLTSGWSEALPNALAKVGNVGVTGPLDLRNKEILTQSFVHSSHLSLFPRYFPKPFRNWWSDDWLSQIYKGRWVLSPVEVMHAPKKATTSLKNGNRIYRYSATYPVYGDYITQRSFVEMLVRSHQDAVNAFVASASNTLNVSAHYCKPFQQHVSLVNFWRDSPVN
jgi:hypothetical protein